jgi:HK97 gp10 family phage protein
MDVSITLDGNSQGIVTLQKFSAEMNANLGKAISQSGMLMERALKLNLKGSNPTTFWFRSPHRELRSRTGHLRQSITSKNKRDSAGIYAVEVGTPTKYGRFQEKGATIPVTKKMRGFLAYKGVFLKKSTTELHLPARPWFAPTFESNKDKVIKLISDVVFKPVE